MQWGTRQFQSIFRPTNHKSTMPANWRPCLIPHWQSYCYQAIGLCGNKYPCFYRWYPQTSEQLGFVLKPQWFFSENACVSQIAMKESMLTNFTQMSLCNIFAMQAILYQFKREVTAWKRLGCLQTPAKNLVANNGNALYGFKLFWRTVKTQGLTYFISWWPTALK